MPSKQTLLGYFDLCVNVILVCILCVLGGLTIYLRHMTIEWKILFREPAPPAVHDALWMADLSWLMVFILSEIGFNRIRGYERPEIEKNRGKRIFIYACMMSFLWHLTIGPR